MTLMLCFYGGCVAFTALTWTALNNHRRAAPVPPSAPPRHVRIIRPPYDWDAQS